MLATSLSALTAGCLSGLPPLGDDQRYGRLDVPPADEPTYRKWLPAPTSVDPSIKRYYFTAMQPESLRPDAPELFVARRADTKANLDYFGIGFENYDQVLDSSVGTVIEATFDRTKVIQTITDSGYERAGEYRGYPVFARSDVPRRVAIGDDVVVWTSAAKHELPHLEAIIDTGNGESPRFHKENAAFERLTSAAGSNPYLGVNTDSQDPSDRPAMLADTIRFDDNAAYQVVHYHYTSDRIPTKQTLEAALKEDDYRFAEKANEFDVTIDGQLATVETQVPLRSEQDIDPKYELPQVTWGVTHDEDAEKVTFRHEAGESVPADRLYYDFARPAAPLGRIDKRPLWTGVDTVSAGAEGEIDLTEYPDATRVHLVYSAGGTHFYVLLGFDLRGDSDG